MTVPRSTEPIDVVQRPDSDERDAATAREDAARVLATIRPSGNGAATQSRAGHCRKRRDGGRP